VKENFLKEFIVQEFELNNIKIIQEQISLLLYFMRFLLEENAKYNLTAITEPEDIVRKHFIDSCFSAEFIKKDSKIIDIGAGGGFPGIPLAILRPDCEFILVDSVVKKVDFLKKAIKSLKLLNCKAVCGRGEELAHKLEYREKFDYCVARVVARLNTLCEYCFPFIKIEGEMIAYKSKDSKKEILEAKNAIKILGGRVRLEKEFKLCEMERSLIFIEKEKSTPLKYPRGQNKAKTNPL